jgi:nitrite reductase/ring-hydroxylating ferredoxin subunit
MVVARVGEVAPGRTKKFVFQCGAEEVEGFVLNHEGRLHAYVNRCRHVAMGLDWVENQFFTEDGCYVQCATHGAFYLPDTGECIAGPPCGKSLHRIPLTIEGDEVVAEPPGLVAD